MKLLLLLAAACVFATTANAQVVMKDLTKKQADVILKKYRKADQPTIIHRDSTFKLNGNFLTGRKKPGVYRLPQDGMPCIVPDTKDIAAIPNAWKGIVRTPYKGKKPAIPNPSQPNVQPETK